MLCSGSQVVGQYVNTVFGSGDFLTSWNILHQAICSRLYSAQHDSFIDASCRLLFMFVISSLTCLLFSITLAGSSLLTPNSNGTTHLRPSNTRVHSCTHIPGGGFMVPSRPRSSPHVRRSHHHFRVDDSDTE